MLPSCSGPLPHGWGLWPCLPPVAVMLQAQFQGHLKSSGFHPLHSLSPLNMFETCPHLQVLRLCQKSRHLPGIVVYAQNPSPWEAEAGLL